MEGKRSIGTGYIIVPENIEYRKYLESCFKTKTVSIITEESEVYHKVKVTPTIFSSLRFPDPEKKEFSGTLVIYVRPSFSSIPSIISYLELNDVGSDLLPGQWKMTTYTQSSRTSLIQGDTEEGTLDIVTHSEKKGSEIVLRATSKTKDSIVRVETDGSFFLSAENLVQLNTEGKIVLGDEDLVESTLLGKKWKGFEEEFIELLKGMTFIIPPGVVTGGAVTFPSPAVLSPASQSLLEEKKSKLSDILSTLVFLQ